MMIGLRPFAAALLLAAATPALAAPDAALLRSAQAEAPNTLTTLEKLVKIESGSYDKAGIIAIGNLLATELAARGATVERVTPKAGANGEIIVGRLAGTGKARVTMLAHMDTVYQPGQLAETPWRIEGNRAYGPGVADAKSGIAVILSTLKLLKPMDYAALTVVFNTDEEIGSVGSGDIITELSRGQSAVLSFEPTLAVPREALVAGTSGTNTVTVHIIGKASHAGNAPEQGVNALVEAAHIIATTRDLDLGRGKRRFNWTQIEQEGGTRNIIPDDVTLIGDLREVSDANVAAFEAELKERLATPMLAGAKVSVDVRINRPAFTADAAGLRLVESARAFYVEAGGPELPVEPRTGGGTDAGFAARAGVPIIEVLGLPGFGYHSGNEEYVLTDAIPRRLYLAASLIRDINK